MVLHLPDTWSNWTDLEMLVFEERGKPKYPEKNLYEDMEGMGKESITLSMELAKTQCYEFECFEQFTIGVEGGMSDQHKEV